MEETWNVEITDDEANAAIIDKENYALDKKVQDRVQDSILSLLPSIRDQRTTLEERWKRLERVWMGKHGVRLYEGQSDIYVPMARKIVETFVSQIVTQIFPANPMFFLGGVGPNLQVALQNQAHIQALIENDVEQARIKTAMPLFLRRGFIMGCSIVKNFWKLQTSENYRRVVVGGDLGLEPTVTAEPYKMKLYEGPTFDVVDIFRWYIHPITARNIDDARLIFEDLDVDWAHLKSMERAGVYKNINRIKESAEGSAGTGIDASNRNVLVESDGYTVDNMIKDDRYRLTEIWAKFDLYGDGRMIPCKIVQVGDTVLEVRQNPFFNQRPPYQAWRVTDRIDNFYGQGLLENIESMQYAFNALINQGIDNATWQMNPMIVVNKSNLASNPADISVAPRAFLYTWADPRASVHFERPPETYKIAFEVAQLMSGMMQDIAGAPPILQGKVGGRTQTATEADILRQGAGAFTNILAMKLESEVLSPLLQNFYFLEQQFRDEETYVKITGGQPPLQILPQDLVGDYQFTWHVSTDAAQRQMMLQASGGGMTAAPGPPEEQGGMPMAGPPSEGAPEQQGQEIIKALMGGMGG